MSDRYRELMEELEGALERFKAEDNINELFPYGDPLPPPKRAVRIETIVTYDDGTNDHSVLMTTPMMAAQGFCSEVERGEHDA